MFKYTTPRDIRKCGKGGVEPGLIILNHMAQYVTRPVAARKCDERRGESVLLRRCPAHVLRHRNDGCVITLGNVERADV